MHATRRQLLLAAMAGAWPAMGTHAQGADKPADKVVVAGWSKAITEITPLLVDADKGFYRAQGIALEYVPGAGGGDAVRNILSGQGDVAFTDPGSFFMALDKGEKLRAVYDIYPRNVFNVVSLKKNGITQPAQLKGKRIGVYSLSSGTRQALQVLLHQAGLRESDVEIVVTGLLNFSPLLQGQVDATAATDTGLAIGHRHGLGDVNVIEVGKSLPVSSDLFVVREETLRTRRDAIRRFLHAYRDASAWMISQPEEAASLASRRAIDGSDVSLNLEIIRIRNASAQSEVTRRHGLGTLDIASLQAAADVYRQLGLVSRRIDVAQAATNELLAAG